MPSYSSSKQRRRLGTGTSFRFLQHQPGWPAGCRLCPGALSSWPAGLPPTTSFRKLQNKMPYLLPFFKWTDSTWLAETMRGSRLYVPLFETFHLLALTLLCGAILMLNLRLCRLVMKAHPVQQVARYLSPWLLRSLGIILL